MGQWRWSIIFDINNLASSWNVRSSRTPKHSYSHKHKVVFKLSVLHCRRELMHHYRKTSTIGNLLSSLSLAT